MAILGLKPWVKPFGKMSIFRLFKLLVFIAQKGVFFFVLEYHRIHFPGLYCLKKKLEKWPFLDQNNGLTPLEKCYFFDFLNFLFNVEFIVHRIHFPSLYCVKKKKLEKWPFVDQNHGLTPCGKMSIFGLYQLLVFLAQKGGLTPLEKCQFFDFLYLLFLLPRKAF